MAKFANPVKVSHGGITVWPDGIDGESKRIDQSEIDWVFGPPATSLDPERPELTTRGTATFGDHKFEVKAGVGNEHLPWMTIKVEPYIDYACDFSFEEIE